ncbi:sodium-dependent transporter [Psychrobacillus psychrodurans]|uniref:sodium-dependent transporter n=1 Tax=Psychrobacillus TaxID=1221880 RepID=UPI0008EE802C|nr:sodium-dependent transporter [Psychrobacillus psychrodurans]MCK1997399.1 sodium-dependent transporter [Psychrobacillus psychrodurans]MCZ8541738.1 sodium-dependent transporter [Psychrobacillus psychrodurans]SFN08071.1 neurotransmitter:Na+ symporter, NSS family [Psychrobacillus psychrodurans]
MQTTEQWSSKIGFILSAAGSAIGVGAIWKLPYVTGISGGGAFFLLFILFSLFMGFPLLLAEFVIGRSTQKEAISAYRSLAPNSNWHWIGRLGVFTCFLLLSFYSVIGGWIVIYIAKGLFGEIISEGADYGSVFNLTIGNPLLVLVAQFVFLAITVLVVAKGIQNGIEKVNKILMPALFGLFIVLIIRSLTLDNAMEGVKFFLAPDFSNITSESVLFAMGQAFFSLSVGVSVMVTYSSYLSKKESLIQPAISIVSMNLVIALLAGLAIFPAVFSLGLEPAEGPGLLFVVLPAVFDQIVFGEVFLIGFLALFLFATLTSAFSMLEIIVASIVKEKAEKRTKYAYMIGILIFLVGVPSALSYSIFADILIFSKSLFDSADYLVSNILMPLGVLLISIFVSHKIEKSTLREELLQHSRLGATAFNIWLFIMKYIIPLVIILVFLDITGILNKIVEIF